MFIICRIKDRTCVTLFVREYSSECDHCKKNFPVTGEKCRRIRYLKKQNKKCFCSAECKRVYFGDVPPQIIPCRVCEKLVKRQYLDTKSKHGNFCSRLCFHKYYGEYRREKAHEMGLGKIYDVITKGILTGTNKEIGDKLGIHASNISNIRHGKHDIACDRYCLLERKDELIFQLKNVETGEVYDCVSLKTIFIYLGISPTQNECKYIYELRMGRQDYASLGKYLVSVLAPKKPFAFCARNSHITKEAILIERLKSKITRALRSRMGHAVRDRGAKKSNNTMTLIGCTISFFMGFIEAKFLDGMSWENHGEWHIDHIIPCNTFNMLEIEEQRKCFHYTNLRPLWGVDNLKRPKDGSDISKDERDAILSSQNLPCT